MALQLQINVESRNDEIRFSMSVVSSPCPRNLIFFRRNLEPLGSLSRAYSRRVRTDVYDCVRRCRLTAPSWILVFPGRLCVSGSLLFRFRHPTMTLMGEHGKRVAFVNLHAFAMVSFAVDRPGCGCQMALLSGDDGGAESEAMANKRTQPSPAQVPGCMGSHDFTSGYLA